MISVFISYASEDFDDAKKLQKFLINHGYSVWLDRDNILPGEKWKDAIERGLNNAHFIIPCLSTKSVSKRGFVQREMRFAIDKADEFFDDDIFIVPVKFEPCDIPVIIKDFQCADFYTTNGREDLLRGLTVGSEKRKLTEGAVDKNKSETVLAPNLDHSLC